MKSFLRGSFFLLFANIAAGLFNYYFQIRAATLLAAGAYGVLNTWLAYLGLLLSLAGVAQIASNFFTLSEHLFRKVAIAVLVFTMASFLILAFFREHSVLLIFSLLLGTVFQGVVGQFQGRTWFAWMGGSLLLAAVVKIAITYLHGMGISLALSIEELFYLSIPFSYGTVCMLQAVVMFLKHDRTPRIPRLQTQLLRSTLSGAAVLALAMALVPQLDLLNLRWLHTDETVGLFSRASLFAKGIFFAALTLLQVTLPYHIRADQLTKAARGQSGPDIDPSSHDRLPSIAKFEVLGLAACVAASFFLAWVAPWVARRFLGFDLGGIYQNWVLLSCLSLTALYGHLQKIQLACALGNWKKGMIRTLALVSSMVLWRLIQPATVQHYLMAALGFYLALYVFNEETAGWLLRRLRRASK